MTQPVIYLHGYGSSGNSDTAKNLRAILGDAFHVESPTYDCSRPIAARDQLVAGVGRIRSIFPGKTPILVGTSLGGFFANYISRRCEVPAVLVNPSLSPSTSLAKYAEEPVVLAQYHHLELEELRMQSRPRRIVVLGQTDRILDHNVNGEKLYDVAQLVWLDMGHRIEPAFVPQIGQLVQSLVPHVT